VKKAATKAAPFTGYSEEQWAKITALIPSDTCLVGRRLRDRLEQLGRNYVWMLTRDLDSLKFFVAKEKQAVEFRRQILEDGRFPLELQQCAAEALDKLERFCQNRTALLVKGYGLKIQSIEDGQNYTRPRE
jgi:hypothetical protein